MKGRFFYKNLGFQPEWETLMILFPRAIYPTSRLIAKIEIHFRPPAPPVGGFVSWSAR